MSKRVFKIVDETPNGSIIIFNDKYYILLENRTGYDGSSAKLFKIVKDEFSSCFRYINNTYKLEVVYEPTI